MLSLLLARAISILGHPVILISIAALIATAERELPLRHLASIGATLCMLGGMVMGYSWLQVRLGRWSHVDASVGRERKTLHFFLAGIFFVSAFFLRQTTAHGEMARALSLSGGIIIVGMATASWLKLSLHATFAAFAAMILWPNRIAVAIGFCIALAVAWSRLKLQRHVLADVVVGLFVGGGTGVVYQVWTKLV